MIDTDKYEGHTEGPWYLIGAQQIVYDKDNNPIAEVEYFAQEHRSYYNKALIADAPLLLAEVEKLQAWKKLVSDIVQQHDGSHLRKMLKELTK